MIIPPQNLEAEESVIGSMLLTARAIEEAAEALRPEDFYRASHGVIFQTAVDMHYAGDPVDAVTLADRLARGQKLEDVGGSSRIAELAALVPAASNVGHYARIVSNEAARRNLLHAAQMILQTTAAGGDADDLIALAEEHLARATSIRSHTQAVSITHGLEELIEERREALRTGKPIMGLLTGLTPIDNALTGLWPGQLILIAARPGQGKSAIALNIAENFADRGDAVLLNSLEMGLYELQIRSLARAAHVDGKRLQTGQLEQRHVEKLPDGIAKVKAREASLFINDDGNMTMPTLRAEASRMVRQNDIKLIVVDYIQLMQGVGETRNDQVGSISRGLKQLARQLNIPIIALSQMNRSIETRTDKRPTLSDLRDSGSLEQDSDVVMFLHNESAYDTSKEPNGDMEVIVAKNRKGETAATKLIFLRRFSSFTAPSLKPATPEAA